MRLHIAISGLLWCAISLGFVAVSAWAMRIFYEDVEASKQVPDIGMRRTLARDLAFDHLRGEQWRMSQHVLSFIIGVTSFFISPIPAHTVPLDAQLFGSFVLFGLFYLNFASGINSVRAVRASRRRRALIRSRRPKKARRHTPLERIAERLRRVERRAAVAETRADVAHERADVIDTEQAVQDDRLLVVEEVTEVKHTTKTTTEPPKE